MLRRGHLLLVGRCVSWKQRGNESHFIFQSAILGLFTGELRPLMLGVVTGKKNHIDSWHFVAFVVVYYFSVDSLFWICLFLLLFKAFLPSLQSKVLPASSAGGLVVTDFLNLLLLWNFFFVLLQLQLRVFVFIVVWADLCGPSWLTEPWSNILWLSQSPWKNLLLYWHEPAFEFNLIFLSCPFEYPSFVLYIQFFTIIGWREFLFWFCVFYILYASWTLTGILWLGRLSPITLWKVFNVLSAQDSSIPSPPFIPTCSYGLLKQCSRIPVFHYQIIFDLLCLVIQFSHIVFKTL